MPDDHLVPLPNGLPLHRVALEGTRAVTILVAFDAGARTERPEENGMAHFLEHLVFKGGEKYATYRDVNETAERLGAQLNAYTSHDLVAFHITARAEAAMEAIDLLTDFVARPHLDAEELDRERGVVIQEIARANDQPAVGRRAPDRPRPPSATTRSGARCSGPRSTCAPSRATRSSPSASAAGRARAAARSSSATSTTCRPTARSTSSSRASPTCPNPSPTSRRRPSSRRRSSRSATPTSRTCGMSYRP